jgi:hypothetical protein
MTARTHAEWVALGYPRGMPANAAPCFDPVRLPLTPYEQACADAYAAKCAGYLGDDAAAGHERPGFYDEIQRRGE